MVYKGWLAFINPQLSVGRGSIMAHRFSRVNDPNSMLVTVFSLQLLFFPTFVQSLEE